MVQEPPAKGAGWGWGGVGRSNCRSFFRLPALLAKLDRRIDKNLEAAHRAQKDAMAKQTSILLKLIGNLRYQTVFGVGGNLGGNLGCNLGCLPGICRREPRMVPLTLLGGSLGWLGHWA